MNNIVLAKASEFYFKIFTIEAADDDSKKQMY